MHAISAIDGGSQFVEASPWQEIFPTAGTPRSEGAGDLSPLRAVLAMVERVLSGDISRDSTQDLHFSKFYLDFSDVGPEGIREGIDGERVPIERDEDIPLQRRLRTGIGLAGPVFRGNLGQPVFVEDIIWGKEQLRGSVLDKPVRPERIPAGDIGRHGEHVLPHFERQLGRDKRAGALFGFHDDEASGESGDDFVPLGKSVRGRGRTDGKMGKYRAAFFDDAVEEVFVNFGIGLVNAAPEHDDGVSSCADSGFVSQTVDAERPAGNYGNTGSRELRDEAFDNLLAVRGRLAGTDHADFESIRIELPPDVDEERDIGDIEQFLWIIRFGMEKNAGIYFGQTLFEGIERFAEMRGMYFCLALVGQRNVMENRVEGRAGSFPQLGNDESAERFVAKNREQVAVGEPEKMEIREYRGRFYHKWKAV